jgi:hypothetical protein
MASSFLVTGTVRQGEIEIAPQDPCGIEINFAVEMVNVDGVDES